MLPVPTQRLESLLAGEAMPSAVVDGMLEEATRAGASDIHLEPVAGGLEIRFRLDGVLVGVATAAPERGPFLVARLKVLAGLATYRTDVPQDGRIGGPTGDHRLSTYPTVRGEKAVVRLFGRAADLRLEDLGLSGEATAGLTGALAGREGLVVLTGPAGSGKTSTIYACLDHLGRHDPVRRQIVTVEDPVERLVEGVTQTEINPPAGLTFATCLRSLLRQDPEVLMVGEVRDRATADLAVEAALTGHLVLTTLHAGTAVGVFGRLLEMGIEPHLLTSVVRVALAQRLVRRLCEACAGDGCPTCLATGFRGRLPIDEVLTMTDPLRRAILGGADATTLAAATAGGPTLADRAAGLVAAGRTTAAEVGRVLAGSLG